jgi:hypothetical protein
MVAFITYRRLVLVFISALLLLGSYPVRTGAVFEDCTEKQLRSLGVVFVNCIGEEVSQCTVNGVVSASITSGEDLLGLTFPTSLGDEGQLISKMRDVITSRYSESNWIGLEEFIIDRSRENDVNPLFIVATGAIESQFGNSRAGKEQNNYFGAKSSNSSYLSFPTPQDGIAYLIDRMPLYLNGELSNGRYKGVTTIYEYSSIHQTGSIVYPGEPFDPNDIDDKPGNTQDLWDPAMEVYISWDEEANNRPEVNSAYKGKTYNPLSYYRSNISVINSLTGQTFPDTPGGVASCDGVLPGANGWDLPGEGSSPMTYFSQRSSGDDPAVQGYFGGESYGPGPISHCGCGPTSWAMIVSTLTGSEVTPDTVADWASTSGFQQGSDGNPCGGSLWWWGAKSSGYQEKWGVKSTRITLPEASSKLKSGSLIMVSVGPGPFTAGGHLLVMRAVTDDGKYLFADPNDRNDTSEPAFSLFQGESKSRTPLAAEDFEYSIKGIWAVEKL